MFRRRSTQSPADLEAVTAAAQAAQDAADAAHAIALVAERQAAIISAQADEIANLRRQLADTREAVNKATEAAGYWYRQAEEQHRQHLAGTIGANLGRYIRHN